MLRHHQLQHDGVEVRALVPAVPSGKMNDPFLRLLVAIVAPIAMNARAIEMGTAGRQAQGLGSRRGQQAVECRHPGRIKRVSGPPEGRIVELVGGHAG